MFSEQIGVLDHGALERLEDNAASFQLFGNDVAFDQLIVGEDQASGDFIEPARILQNIFRGRLRKAARLILNGDRSRRSTLENRQG